MKEEEALVRLIDNIKRVIVGKDDKLELILAALVAGGHVLVEDLPGTGKTVLARALAASIDADFSRIQFTPDLLPTDITGLNYFNPKEADFNFRKGPIFTSILLADEINRATPRTQSALLEAMGEGQVTIDGKSYKLKDPFFVIATQNPIETTATFPLPVAQLDRFAIQLSLGPASLEDEIKIINRMVKGGPNLDLDPVLSPRDLRLIREKASAVYLHPDLVNYIARLVIATRKSPDLLAGSSSRGSIDLARMAKARAFIKGRSYVSPEDIKYLAPYVLAHRLASPGLAMGREGRLDTIEEILAKTQVPTEDWDRK